MMFGALPAAIDTLRVMLEHLFVSFN